MHWRKWSDITMSKMAGGIGFKEFDLMNLAHLAKQAWRVYNIPDSMWVSILKGLYFSDSDFWKARKKRGSSWGWNNLIQGRDFLLSHGRWIISDGTRVDLWRDNWFQNSPVVSDPADYPHITVNTLFKEGQMDWDPGKAASHFPREIVEKILKTPLSSSGAFRADSGFGATATIVRDCQGSLLTFSSSRIFASSPLEAEALAVRPALQLANNLQCHHVVYESDNLILVDASRDNKTPRSTNVSAHLLAAHSLHSSFPRAALWNLPPDVLESIRKEVVHRVH
ncbi:Ribonuclease H superfamily [Sesbania bispinosa]|nr:Ribonuclease H superfamily [Sesbania bispinosa]